MCKMSPRRSLSVALTFLICCTAFDESRGESITVGTYSFSVTGSPSPVTIPVSIPAFDPSLGVLTRVQLAFNATETGGSVSFENRANQPILFGYSYPIAYTVSIPGFTSGPFDPGPPPVTNFLGAFDGKADFQGPDSMTTTFNIANSNETRNYGPGPPPAFIGLGNLNATLSIGQTFLLSSSLGPLNLPAVRVNTPGTITGTFSVTYTFVPEPPGLVLLGIGMIGAVALAAPRRRWPSS
jgi:hypothetical protein